MSQRLIRLAKNSYRDNNVFIHKCIRLFSSTGPYLTVGTRVKEVLPSGCTNGDVLLFDPAKEELVTLQGKTIPKELKHEEIIGASHGWVFFSDRPDRTVRISDIFNPLASKSNPTVIPLPRLTDLPSEQIEQVCNVAMSSSSPLGEENCLVAIKFSGCQLSLCRPSRDLEWINIITPFHCCENSNLMYSKRDHRLYLPAPGGKHLFSYHLNSTADPPELHELVYRGLPELDQSEWEILSSCSRREYLVESTSSDERYLVKWYAHGFYSSVLKGIDYKTKRFMVFSEEETTEGKIMCYTEDIGDMCIFLATNNEAFCIPASSCPGLKPSTIYFVGRGFGSYHLTTGDIHHYKAPGAGVITTPYWLPPFSI